MRDLAAQGSGKITTTLSSGFAQRLLQSSVGNGRCARLPYPVGLNDVVGCAERRFTQLMIAGHDLSSGPAEDIDPEPWAIHF
jgi:hypothetical protein